MDISAHFLTILDNITYDVFFACALYDQRIHSMIAIKCNDDDISKQPMINDSLVA